MVTGWHRRAGVDRWAESEKETNRVFTFSPHRQGVTGNFLRDEGSQGCWILEHLSQE